MPKNACSKMISVIIPVYNAELYIGKCIESVLGQSYSDLELLLINDGSFDHSGDICEEYAKKDPRVQVFHKKNGGVSAARNLGIDQAKGRYLIFVDADDQIHRDLLKIYMQMNTDRQVLICEISNDIFDLEKKYENQEKDSQYNILQKENFMRLFAGDYINSPVNKLYHTKILKKNNIRYPENLSLGEDLLFNLAYFRCAPKEYKIISYPLYYYQEDHAESLSNSFRLDLFDIQLYLFEQLKQFLLAENIWSEKNQKIYYRIFWDRLYLTVKIYLTHRKKNKDLDTTAKLHMVLHHEIWKELEQKLRECHMMNWKRILKKYHVIFLKNFIKSIDN